MTDPTPKRRGRQPTGTALSNAERQRRYIDRLKAQIPNSVTDAEQVAALTLVVESQKGEIALLEAQLKAVSDELSRAIEREYETRGEYLLLTQRLSTPEALVSPARPVSAPTEVMAPVETPEPDKGVLFAVGPDHPLFLEGQARADQKKRPVSGNPALVARVMDLAPLSEKKTAEKLRSEGFRVSPRSVGTIRKAHRPA